MCLCVCVLVGRLPVCQRATPHLFRHSRVLDVDLVHRVGLGHQQVRHGVVEHTTSWRQLEAAAATIATIATIVAKVESSKVVAAKVASRFLQRHVG